ncbi:MAG: AAA family ATPase [Planctomycetota bacterium]|jgi:type II secretory pathway predicted ATPase ExeA|nr:AAA family ATPase [Planctomycetota bacterium]
MYEQHWGLSDKPFRNTPDPRYFFFSPQHEEALTRMLYCILEGQGGMLLSGEVGCGKTMLARVVLDTLDAERFEAAYLTYSSLSTEEFLREILRQFGVSTLQHNRARLLSYLSDCFAAHQAAGRATLIFVDEAQLAADADTLEEMRLLMNFQQDRQFTVSLILLGQPEIREMVKASPQFQQRLTVRMHLGALNAEESRAYLHHRLRVADGREDLFTAAAETLLVEAAQGVPRRLNGLADMSLLLGYGKKAPLIDEDLARQAVADSRN